MHYFNRILAQKFFFTYFLLEFDPEFFSTRIFGPGIFFHSNFWPNFSLRKFLAQEFFFTRIFVPEIFFCKFLALKFFSAEF